MKHIITIIFLCLVNTSIAQENHLFIKAEELFTAAEHRSGQLSPTGKYFSFILQTKEEAYIELVDISEQRIFSLASIAKDVRLLNFTWVNKDVIYLETSSKRGRNKQTLLTFERIGNEFKTKAVVLEKGYLVNILANDPVNVLFAKTERINSYTIQRLYKVSVEDLKRNDFSNAKQIDKSNKNLIRYKYDVAFKRVFGEFYSDETKLVSVQYRTLEKSNWFPLFTKPNKDETIEPVGFIGPDRLAVLTNKESDTVVLQTFNISSQTLGDILYENSNNDLINAYVTADGKLNSVEYFKNGLPFREWLGATTNEIVERLRSSFESGSPNIIDESSEFKRLLIFVTGDDNAGEYYVYDYKNDSMTKMVSVYPKLDKYKFAPSESFSVANEEGVEIEAFITRPQGYDANVLLVRPHGGPIGVRDNNLFNREVQFLANRGFTVLRVNFRGSEGFGKSFRKKGVGQFGQLIEQDISAVVDSVLANNNFNKVCAIGASYGAYSSMVLAAKHPEIYDCVIASFGIYDIPLLFNSTNRNTTDEFRDKVARVVGENKPENQAISPVYYAQKFNIPILLIGGVLDRIAHYEHTNRMHYMLEKHNKDVSLVAYKYAAHGHLTWSEDRHQAALEVDFLHQKLNIPIPDIAFENDHNKEAYGYDFTILSEYLQNGDDIDKDLELAAEYLVRAEPFDSMEASYSMGVRYLSGDNVKVDHAKGIELLEKSVAAGHPNAKFRLGTAYMNGWFAPTNDKRALDLFTQVQQQSDVLKVKLALAQLRCLAEDESVKDVQACVDEFRLISKQLINREDASLFSQSLARTLVKDNYTKQERNLLIGLVTEAYKIESFAFELSVEDVGYFEYIKSAVFGRKGELNYLTKPSTGELLAILAEENLYLGFDFEIEFGSFLSSSEITMILVEWKKFDKDGQLVSIKIEPITGKESSTWNDYFKIENVEKGSSYQLSVYDVHGKRHFQQKFVQ
ncbi:prolyl oligopeptidase family serine peptidase [Glaciecola sp. MF2-115]|uniref:prolyl oligopeptidase family serine peptidase n=1 Tax=Glaciecola sp. MF2-115 TaxID=3384827 RepID=UPI00399F212D